MILLTFAFACGHRLISWEFQPAPVVSAPFSEVVVVAGGVECQAVANEFAMALAMREGISIQPNARTRLLLNMCSVETETRMVSGRSTDQAEAGGASSSQSLIGRGKGSAMLTVQVEWRPKGMIKAEALRVQRSTADVSGSSALSEDLKQGVLADIATDLVRQLAPMPEIVERRWYRKPKPGSAQSLHNKAVEAERDGNFKEAVRLARQAVATDKNRHTADYLRAVEARLDKP